MSTLPLPIPLSRRERRRLAELEAVVERAWPSFGGEEFIDALVEIRNAHLYRNTHPSFEDYLALWWGLPQIPRRRCARGLQRRAPSNTAAQKLGRS